MNYKTTILATAIIAQIMLLILKSAGCYWSWWIICSPILAAVGYVLLVVLIAVAIEGYVKFRNKIWEKGQ